MYAELMATGSSTLGITTFYIELGSVRKNGHIESLGAHLRDELLDGEPSFLLTRRRTDRHLLVVQLLQSRPLMQQLGLAPAGTGNGDDVDLTTWLRWALPSVQADIGKASN